MASRKPNSAVADNYANYLNAIVSYCKSNNNTIGTKQLESITKAYSISNEVFAAARRLEYFKIESVNGIKKIYYSVIKHFDNNLALSVQREYNRHVNAKKHKERSIGELGNQKEFKNTTEPIAPPSPTVKEITIKRLSKDIAEKTVDEYLQLVSSDKKKDILKRYIDCLNHFCRISKQQGYIMSIDIIPICEKYHLSFNVFYIATDKFGIFKKIDKGKYEAKFVRVEPILACKVWERLNETQRKKNKVSKIIVQIGTEIPKRFNIMKEETPIMKTNNIKYNGPYPETESKEDKTYWLNEYGRLEFVNQFDPTYTANRAYHWCDRILILRGREVHCDMKYSEFLAFKDITNWKPVKKEEYVNKLIEPYESINATRAKHGFPPLTDKDTEIMTQTAIKKEEHINNNSGKLVKSYYRDELPMTEFVDKDYVCKDNEKEIKLAQYFKIDNEILQLINIKDGFWYFDNGIHYHVEYIEEYKRNGRLIPWNGIPPKKEAKIIPLHKEPKKKGWKISFFWGLFGWEKTN